MVLFGSSTKLSLSDLYWFSIVFTILKLFLKCLRIVVDQLQNGLKVVKHNLEVLLNIFSTGGREKHLTKGFENSFKTILELFKNGFRMDLELF